MKKEKKEKKKLRAYRITDSLHKLIMQTKYKDGYKSVNDLLERIFQYSIKSK